MANKLLDDSQVLVLNHFNHEKQFSGDELHSPVTITLGIEDHGKVSPVKKDLLRLFNTPLIKNVVPKPISPLPTTPKKVKLDHQAGNEQTSSQSGNFIVIEDSSITEPVLYTETKEKVSTKKDSTHLLLPDEKTVSEAKRWNRFLAPPSTFTKTSDAEKVRNIRKEAVKNDNYQASIIPMGYAGVKKDEKAVLIDVICVLDVKPYDDTKERCGRSNRFEEHQG